MTLLRQGPDERSGTVTVGVVNPVVYQNVERLDITPIDPLTGLTGTPPGGRIVVLHHDPFETNDSFLNPAQIERVGESPTSPTIDPGGLTTPFAVNGDEDWYVFRPKFTSTYQVRILFQRIVTVPSGRPGLPGTGDLSLDIYDANGAPIVSGVADGGGDNRTAVFAATPTVAQFATIYVRVKGAGDQPSPSVNLYDFDNIAALTGQVPPGEVPPGVGNVDVFGPQVTGVVITSTPAYDLFDPKPSTDGPTPLVNSLTISFRDLSARAPGFLYPALDPVAASTPGTYVVQGDHNGLIAISQIIVTNDAVVVGGVPTATVELVFAQPLPDDRFTLTINDNLLDPANNPLDGESNVSEPQEVPTFPSGDSHPGTDFVARFTVDSRAEIGVWGAGSVHVDSNGNFGWDPEGKDGDEVNEDVTYVLGFTSDNIFAGNFAALVDDPNTAQDERVADGFAKLAAYGKLGKNYRWLIDVNNDGVPDLVLPNPVALNGLPAAGNFDGNATNGDEVALKVGSAWYLDKNHSLTVDNAEKLAGSNMVGYPIVGDFDGDGTDDLGARTDDVFSLNLSSLGPIDGFSDVQFKVAMNSAFIGPQERPIAADFDGDGIDDIGLWVPNHTGGTPLTAGEWYILVSDGRRIYDPGNPNADRIRVNPEGGGNIVDFVPVPFGSDEFAVFGGDDALPVVGNFDPHHIQVPLGGLVYGLTNLDDADDVNGDGVVTANDVLILVNEVNLTGPRGLPLGVLGGPFLDVNRDWDLTAADVLAVINRVNLEAVGAASGEGEAGIAYAGPGLPLDPGPVPQGFTSVSSRAGEASSPLAAERVDQYFTLARNVTESASVNGGSAGVRVGSAWNDAGDLELDDLLSDIASAVHDADDF